MARTVNYEAKIETIEAKIQKKKDEIATLYETWETQTMELEAEEA